MNTQTTSLDDATEAPLRSALTDLLENQRDLYRARRDSVRRHLRQIIGELQEVSDGLDAAPGGDLCADFAVLNQAVGFSAQLDRQGVGGDLAALMAQAQMIVNIERALNPTAEDD